MQVAAPLLVVTAALTETGEVAFAEVTRQGNIIYSREGRGERGTFDRWRLHQFSSEGFLQTALSLSICVYVCVSVSV